METQTLLCLRQPLQQDVNTGVELLSLHHMTNVSQAHRKFTCCVTTAGALQYLTQGLLQSGLFGHRQVAHRLPAGAQLLHLNFDPGRVVVAALDQLPS